MVWANTADLPLRQVLEVVWADTADLLPRQAGPWHMLLVPSSLPLIHGVQPLNREIYQGPLSLSLTVENRMLSHQPSTSLFVDQSSQGAFFSAIKFLHHGMTTGIMCHPRHSKWHEAGFVLEVFLILDTLHFWLGNSSWLPTVICQGCLFSAITVGCCHGGKMLSSPISFSSTLFVLVTGPTLPFPRQ